MIGTLYTHVLDSKQFLLVRRDKAFPEDIYRPSEWRIVAVGVEPMTDQARKALQDRGHFAYRTFGA